MKSKTKRSVVASRSVPPTRAHGTGKRETALRWTINQAAREFGVHREQLERRRRALGIEPGEDGCFSSQDIARMMFGDKEAETIGKIAAERGKIERENAKTDGDFIAVAVVLRIGERFTVAARQQILTSSMTDAEKDETLSALAQLADVDWKQEAINAAA